MFGLDFTKISATIKDLANDVKELISQIKELVEAVKTLSAKSETKQDNNKG